MSLAVGREFYRETNDAHPSLSLCFVRCVLSIIGRVFARRMEEHREDSSRFGKLKRNKSFIGRMERSIERAGLNGDCRALTSPVCFGLLIARPVLMAPKLMVSDGFGPYAIKNSARRPRPPQKKIRKVDPLLLLFID